MMITKEDAYDACMNDVLVLMPQFKEIVAKVFELSDRYALDERVIFYEMVESELDATFLQQMNEVYK